MDDPITASSFEEVRSDPRSTPSGRALAPHARPSRPSLRVRHGRDVPQPSIVTKRADLRAFYLELAHEKWLYPGLLAAVRTMMCGGSAAEPAARIAGGASVDAASWSVRLPDACRALGRVCMVSGPSCERWIDDSA